MKVELYLGEIAKRGNCCEDCKTSWDGEEPFQWHHIDPTTKSFNIGGTWRHKNAESMLSEMNKCVFLCNECHGKRHNKSIIKTKRRKYGFRPLVALIIIMTFAVYPAQIFADSGNKNARQQQQKITELRQKIQKIRTKTWQLQDTVGTPRRPTAHAERHTHSIAYIRWIRKSWTKTQHLAQHDVNSVPHIYLWKCIHSFEAQDWHNRDTGHNGHYGGLQMHYDWGYGINGYAYNYSELQQMQAADRGYRASGYSHSWLLGQWYHPSCA